MFSHSSLWSSYHECLLISGEQSSSVNIFRDVKDWTCTRRPCPDRHARFYRKWNNNRKVLIWGRKNGSWSRFEGCKSLLALFSHVLSSMPLILTNYTQYSIHIKKLQVIINKQAYGWCEQAQVSLIPVESAERCARAIVKSACRGNRYITEPAWFICTYFVKVFFPEVIDLTYRLFYMTMPGTSPKEAISKKVLDLTGAKTVLYPSSIRSSEIKSD